MLVAILIAMVLGLAWVGMAQSAPVKRTVLAVYDSAFESDPSATMVHQRAEMPLNHFGYIVEYHDLRQSLPDIAEMSRFAAVVSWLTYDAPDPSAYLSWAAEVSELGVPYVIIGGIGGPPTGQNLRNLNRVLAPMGIRYTSQFVESTYGTEILFSDPVLMSFERQLDPILPSYPIVERIGADPGVALEVRAPRRELSFVSALVTVGPSGAFVPAEYAVYFDNYLSKSQWIVNPFVLFGRVLGRDRYPIPDTTTVAGRRLFFSRVDGVGWNNDSDIVGENGRPLKSAQVILDRLIRPYGDIPVSVGLVLADIDPILGLGESAADIAREVFALPQVDVASHSRSLPLNWKFFETYSREEEERILSSADEGGAGGSVIEAIGESLGLGGVLDERSRERSKFLAGSRNLPRGYVRDPFNLETEIDTTVAELASLAPVGKSPKVYQWSGDAQPFEAAVEATRRIGLGNINGEGARFDDAFPSVGYVSPIARTIGDERQIYSVNAHELSFTNSWNGAYQGFRNLAVTWQRTETPRRLKGTDLHYHMYSGERVASINAVRQLLDHTRASHIIPITTSDYVAIADGFFSTRIEETDIGVWVISNRGGLNTVRFDDADGLEIDLDRSVGVIGQARHQSSLYITLDAAIEEAAVAVTIADSRPTEVSDTSLVLLESARWQVGSLVREDCGFSFDAHGFGQGSFEWVNVPSGSYDINLATSELDTDQMQSVVEATGGRLTIEVPALNSDVPIRVDVSCQVEDRESVDE